MTRQQGTRRRFRQGGMTIVELMVALLISLLTVLVIVQLMSMYSGQQRSTRAIGDAQMNALIGLNMIEQDVRKAGHGLAVNELQNCASTRTHYGASTGSTPAPITDFSTAAVTVIDGGSNPDTLIVRYAESVRGAIPVRLTADAGNGATSISVETTFGIVANDLLLMMNSAAACALRRVTTVSSGTALEMASSGTTTYNPPTGVTSSTPAWPSFVNGNNVYVLGGFTMRRYSVGATGLVVRQMHANADTALAADMVDMQVQYGVSNAATSSTITEWVSATGGTWASPTLANRKRIRAVRIALVARSAEPASGNVSPATLELWPEATTGQTSAAQSYAVPDRRFRYSVLRSVVPLKNLLWAELL